MPPAQTDRPAPYADPTSPAELRADCLAAEASLALEHAVHRVHRPAPSLHFEDFRQGMPKKDVDMLAAAHRLARALHL